MSETDILFNKHQKNYKSINQQDKSNIIMTTAQIVKHDEYHIHWRIHFFWTLAIICFILAKLWWLVPLPGNEVLPAYRTYPANFFDTIFLTFACALATRSIVVGLVKSFAEGIYPDSIVAFGSTGGVGAMWSCIKHRSGVRYFLIAMLVTACTLLGNALGGELQSSVRIYYKVGGATALDTAQCQHTSQNDYLLASSAYASGLITNTVSDASSLLNFLNASQPMKSFTVSVIKTTLAPIQNTIFLPPPLQQSNTNNLRRRHYHRTTITSTTQPQQTETTTDLCRQNEAIIPSSIPGNNNDNVNNVNNTVTTVSINNNNNSNSSDTNNINNGDNHGDTTNTNNNSDDNCESNTSNTNAGAFSNSNRGGNSYSNDNTNINSTTAPINNSNTNATTLSLTTSDNYYNFTAVIASTPATIFNQSKLTVIRSNTNETVLPYQLGQVYPSNEIPIKLNTFRYTTSDNREAVILYSSLAQSITAGVYVSALATNYTCQSRDDNVMCDEGIQVSADSKSVANAMMLAIQSGDGLYGTNSGDGLALAIINGNSSGSEKLVDALFANPLCSNPELLPSEGNMLYPYSAGRLTLLAILLLLLFAVFWLIGVYLIGYSENTWTELAVSGNLVPQIISKSPNMFEDGELGAKTVGQEMFLDPEEGRMNFAKVHRHGYTVSTTEVET